MCAAMCAQPCVRSHVCAAMCAHGGRCVRSHACAWATAVELYGRADSHGVHVRMCVRVLWRICGHAMHMCVCMSVHTWAEAGRSRRKKSSAAVRDVPSLVPLIESSFQPPAGQPYAYACMRCICVACDAYACMRCICVHAIHMRACDAYACMRRPHMHMHVHVHVHVSVFAPWSSHGRRTAG